MISTTAIEITGIRLQLHPRTICDLMTGKQRIPFDTFKHFDGRLAELERAFRRLADGNRTALVQYKTKPGRNRATGMNFV